MVACWGQPESCRRQDSAAHHIYYWHILIPKSWWLPLAMPSMGHPCYRNGNYQVGMSQLLASWVQRTSMHTLSMLCASSNTTTHSFSSSRDTILDTCNQPGDYSGMRHVSVRAILGKEAIVRAPCCLRAMALSSIASIKHCCWCGQESGFLGRMMAVVYLGIKHVLIVVHHDICKCQHVAG